MGTSVEDAIRLQKFRLMSFLVQRLEGGNIELAHQALNGIEYYATEALNWFEALSQQSQNKLAGFGAKLEEIKKKVNQWRQILNDIWGNRGKLEQVINELDEESISISGFLQQINNLRDEVAAKIKKSKGKERDELVKEQDKLYNLREKVEGLKRSIESAKLRFGVIKEEVRAKLLL